MRYFGGKARIRKKIAEYLTSIRIKDQVYLEPFVGSANVLSLMKNPRVGSDNHIDLIMLLNAVKNNTFNYPSEVTGEQYKQYKHAKENSAMRAFVGFGCSHSGKWFGGYARGKTNQNYCQNAVNQLRKKAKLLNGTTLFSRSYDKCTHYGSLIYCDPPYEGTTQPYGGRFNSIRFWQIMRIWSKYNTVIVSEYKAPEDFECVLEINVKTDMRCAGVKEDRVEKLFKYRG